MDDDELVDAFKRHRVLPPGSSTPVVQIEMVDQDPISEQLLWMEGRGFDQEALAQGQSEPRNPGDDNPFRWPAPYVQRLIREWRGSKDARADVVDARTAPSLEWPQPNAVVLHVGDDAPERNVIEALRAVLPQLREQQRSHDGQPRQRKSRSDLRLQRDIFFAWLHGTARRPRLAPGKIVDEWEQLTAKWLTFLHELPDEWPDNLGSLPQALPAYTEWRNHPSPRVEVLDERTVREAIYETLRPLQASGLAAGG